MMLFCTLLAVNGCIYGYRNHVPGVWVILLCVVGFIEDYEVDLVDADEPMAEAMVQDSRSTDYHLVIPEMSLPRWLGPEVGAHVSAEGL